MRRLIATGGRAGAGKDYVLERLLRYEAGQGGTTKISGFGDLVRSELRTGASRRLQQIHGQLRRQQDEDYWTFKAIEWGVSVLNRGHDAAGITGVRFLNEIEVLREGGFYLVLVEAPEEVRYNRLFHRDGRGWTKEELNDVTETSLDLIPREAWDAVWDNS